MYLLVCAGDLRPVPDMQLAFVGKKFSNYNVREFVQRKAKADFRSNAAQTDKAAVEQMWTQAKRDLEVAKRQALVYSLYGSRQKSVMVCDGHRLFLCTTFSTVKG